MAKFKKTEDISALDADKLAEYKKAAADAFNELAAIDNSELSDDQIVEMREARDEYVAASNIETQRVAEAEAREAELNSLRESMQTADEDESGDEDPNTEGAPAEGEPQVEENPAVEETAPPAEEEEDEITSAAASLDEANTIESEAPAPEKESIVAAGNKSVTSRAASKAPASEAPKDSAPRASLVAAGNVPNMVGGTKFANLKETVPVIQNALKAFPMSPTGAKFRTRQNALVITTPKAQFSQADYANDEELLMAASSFAMNAGDANSLVAAGGWSAVSDTVLDFCVQESTDGLVNMQEIAITRGGLRQTKGPSFADVLNSATGFWDMDEATAEAGVELKTSLRPSDIVLDEVRLDAVGVMIEAGILQRKAYPELVERYEQMALTAHAIKVHRKLVNSVKAYTGAAKTITGGFGNAFDLLHALEAVILGEKQRLFLADNVTFEGWLPFWAKAVFRAELAQRTGVDYLRVTDAQINSWFADRGVRVQWLREFQPLDTDTATGLVLGYPSTVNVVLFPAGTYIKGASDVITLDTVYDSTNLKKNDYVHLFVEQGVLVSNPCGDGLNLTVPFVATGLTAAANTTAALDFNTNAAV